MFGQQWASTPFKHPVQVTISYLPNVKFPKPQVPFLILTELPTPTYPIMPNSKVTSSVKASLTTSQAPQMLKYGPIYPSEFLSPYLPPFSSYLKYLLNKHE